METIHTIGRRKTSVARVYLTKGTGSIKVNNTDPKTYFKMPQLLYKLTQPFNETATLDQFDVKVRVYGGGLNGQVEAVRLGLSRALCKIDEAHRTPLKAKGLLTRDPRMVERKKFGQKKARKQFQFSKR